MIDDDLLSILRCPVSRQKLRAATDDEKRANAARIEDAALISEDGKFFYRSEGGITILLPPENTDAC